MVEVWKSLCEGMIYRVNISGIILDWTVQFHSSLRQLVELTYVIG